jgi:hypothetical protein
LRFLPLFVVGIPVLRAILFFTLEIPIARFQENPVFGMLSSLSHSIASCKINDKLARLVFHPIFGHM